MGFDFNPFDPANHADPYLHYAEARWEGPVHGLPAIGGYALVCYDDVLSVLRDARFSRELEKSHMIQAANAGSGMPAELLAEFELTKEPDITMLLDLEAPDHTRVRNLINKGFMRGTIERLRPRVEALARELLDAAVERGRLDVVEDFAYPLPVMVIAELLGVDPELRDQFRSWSDDLVATVDPMPSPPEAQQRSARAILELHDYLQRLFSERRASPRDDLISALVRAEHDGVRLSEPELLGVCVLLLIAGHETTRSLIGNGTAALIRNPDQWQALRARPGLLKGAVEELLRYDGPVQMTARVALEDTSIRGQRVQAGDLLLLMLGSANRDHQQFPEPDRLDVRRAPNRHLAFGNGTHFCLGASLARLEAQIALGQLVDRFAWLDADTTSLPRRPLFTIRGIESLPVEFDLSAAA